LEGLRKKPTSGFGQEGFIEAACRPIKQKQTRTGASSFARANQLVQILVEFFSRILFQEITTTAGDAWNKALSAQHAAQTEVDLLELVCVVVGKHLSPRLAQGLNSLTRDEIAALKFAFRTAAQHNFRTST
jgi:hypothetical protein